ncbi:C-type lectin lectoxin-Lio3-like, partial [Limulus polyphemus]|uniref:C-type lectin lectoxin-Lio3-like n=1 Tax=Limulus polyphemus TaxID=6850 RepID=A0ABM1T661_LIMPO
MLFNREVVVELNISRERMRWKCTLMKPRAVCLLLMLFLKYSSQAELKTENKCAEGYTYYDTFCYKMTFTDILPWSEAAEVCQKEGAQLVNIDFSNEQEQTFLLSKLQGAHFTDYWIDLREVKTKGNWVYSDSSTLPADFMLWGEGEPNSKSNLQCARISTKFNLYIGDMDCSSSFHAICERSISYSLECLGGYAIEKLCYTFLDKGMTFGNAVLSCERYLSILAVVKNNQTLHVLQNLIKYRPPGGGLWTERTQTNTSEEICDYYIPGLKVLKTDQCGAKKGYICRYSLPIFS